MFDGAACACHPQVQMLIIIFHKLELEFSVSYIRIKHIVVDAGTSGAVFTVLPAVIPNKVMSDVLLFTSGGSISPAPASLVGV